MFTVLSVCVCVCVCVYVRVCVQCVRKVKSHTSGYTAQAMQKDCYYVILRILASMFSFYKNMQDIGL